jgi:hypothetical protein
MYHDREAELQARVDRRRVRLAYASAGEPEIVHAALAELRKEVTELERAAREGEIDLVAACERTPVETAG